MEEHRFPTPEPVELDVRIPSGDIEVETTDGEESVITLDGSEKLLENTEVTYDGRRILVELRGKTPFGLTISLGDLSFGSGRLRVRAQVPHHSAAAFATASADMKVRGSVESLDVKYPYSTRPTTMLVLEPGTVTMTLTSREAEPLPE